MSLKRFEGWEPVTVYAYDGQGRLVSSTPEVEWDESEQAWMLALARYEAECCPHCAGYLPDTTAIEADEAYRADATRCHRCTAIGVEATRIRNNPQPQAVLYTATRRR